MLKFIPQSKDLGILILRVGIGFMFILHGLPKLVGGPERWEGLAQYGLPFLPEGMISVIFGFLAVAAEFGGGILLILGLFHHLACLGLLITMCVATYAHLGDVTGIMDFAKAVGHALELGIVFAALLFTGPGRFAIQKSV